MRVSASPDSHGTVKILLVSGSLRTAVLAPATRACPSPGRCRRTLIPCCATRLGCRPAGGHEIGDERALVARSPGDRKRGGRETRNRPGGDSLALIELRVARGHQREPDAAGDRLERRVRACDLGGDAGGVFAALVGPEPEIPQATGALRQREHWLVEQLVETHLVAVGEPVARREDDPPRLAEKRLPREAPVVRKRQPHEGDVGLPAGEPGGRIVPADLAQLQARGGAPLGEAPRGRRQDVSTDAGDEADGERRRLAHGGIRDRDTSIVPGAQELASAREERLARRRERHSAPIAIEQLDPEGSLELTDLLAQRGLGDEQPLGRAAEVKLFRDGEEVAQIPEVGIHSRRLSEQVLDAAARASDDGSVNEPRSTADAIDGPTPEERLEVIETCTRMAHHADRREWDRLVEIFADEVRLDYTSLQGGEPATVAREQLVDGWREALGGLAATQHLITNHLVEVDGERAVCLADFQATHLYPNPHGDPSWTLGGRYRFELRRLGSAWRLAALTMTAVWARGNQQIMSLAGGATTTRSEESR